MKTLHVTIIISVVSLSAIMFAMYVTQSQYSHDSKTYQYEIHEPYDGADKNFGTVIVQNRTFFVGNLNTFLHTSNATEMEWYGIKFSFPHGSELVNTPEGSIFESYVTFSDDPVPYRIAIGQMTSNTFDFTTVLSTHTNPQVGFTLHNGTIQLLVNWPKIHSDIVINDLNDTYHTYQPVNFQVEVKGFGYYDPGATPDIQIEKQDGTLVWTNLPHPLVLCCPAELEDYDAKFSMTRLGTSPIINQTGTYQIIVSYNNQKLEKQFSVIASQNVSTLDTGTTPMSIDVINTNFTVNYNISQGQVSEMKLNGQTKALEVMLETTGNGTIVISLPRALVDAKLPSGNDDKYYILIDGQEDSFQELNATATNRIISIPFSQGAHEIEIIGAYLI